MHKLKKKLLGESTSKDAAYAAVSGLQKALDTFKGVASNAGVPGLNAGVSGLSTVLAMIQVCAVRHILSTDTHTMTRNPMQMPNLFSN